MANTYATGATGTGGNVFGAKTTNQQESKEFQDFVKQMSGEMNQWERSGQWLVSCFAPLKARLPLSGFSDHSPEEFRLKAYEALKTNTSSSYQAHWTEMQQMYKLLRDALKMPTQEAVQAMRDVYNSKSALEQQEQQQQQPVKQTSLFGKPPGQTVFGVTSQPGSGTGLLGAKPQPSIFGGSSTVFGGNQPTTTSVFGGGATKSVFGGQPTLGVQNTSPFVNQTPSIFGGASNNVFKSSQNSTSTGLFGSSSQSQTSTGPIFGGSSTSTAVGQTTSIFGGGQNQSTGSSIFNSNTQNQPSIFGGTTANAQSSVFQGAQGTAQTAASHAGGGQGIFGSQQQQQQGLFGVQPVQQQQQQQQQPASVFGRQSIFGGSQATPLSGDSVQNTSPFTFGGSTPGSVFGGSAPKGTGSIFGGNTASGRGNGIFGNVQTTGPFGKPSLPFGNTSEASTNSGLFGKPAEGAQPATGQGTPGLFGRPAEGTQNRMHSAISNDHADWYTSLDQLKPEDRAQFEAEAFTAVPFCPPPQELCV
ncbi:nuclear pore complex protein Nup98-Nup96 isoform X2 [Procambarus clarkii]|nr:nucleoporin NUP42-like isoform X2 [Procambarus clarkii]XP_045617602.1 nucleoporin NUP42-like isoform X2 [Procambarus clarkii]